MNITTSQLENVKELKSITAISSYGTGLLTSFISFFIEIFGIENKMLAKKVVKAKDGAIQSLIKQAESTKNGEGIMNLRFELSNLTVFAYGTVYSSNICETSEFDSIPEI